MKDHYIIPIFIPHKGCPFDCIFCNQRRISGQVDEPDAQNVIQIIESHLQTIPGIKVDDKGIFSKSPGLPHVEIAFFGGSFTGIEFDKQKLYLNAAAPYINSGLVCGIRISTRPDRINNEIVDFLKENSVKVIELGVQSMADEVLCASCRGHSSEDVVNASRIIKEKNIILGHQLMVGLPEDNSMRLQYTVEKIISIKPDILRIYPVLVIRNTGLEEMYLKGTYEPLSVNEAVKLCSSLYEQFIRNGIKIIRMGLQTTENIQEGADVLAGPFHPAFSQLVLSEVYYMRMVESINQKKLYDNDEVFIYTHPSNISNIIGQKRTNIVRLKNHFKFKKVNITPCSDMEIDFLLSNKPL